MALTAKQIMNAEFPNGAPATAYTVPALTRTRLTELIISNNSGAARTVKLWIVESGDSRDDGANQITGGGMSVPTGIPFVLAFNTWLEAGDKIDYDADGADVALIGSGLEES